MGREQLFKRMGACNGQSINARTEAKSETKAVFLLGASDARERTLGPAEFMVRSIVAETETLVDSRIPLFCCH